MTITRIERQKNNPRRANIFLDDEFAFGIHTELLVRLGLRAGDALTPERVREIERTEEEYLASQIALRYIRRRVRSEKEVRSRLRNADVAPPVIDRVIRKLAESGLLDDRIFARALVHDLQLRAPMGIRLLRQRLRVKGVPDPVIEELLAEQASADDQMRSGIEVAKKYLRKVSRGRKPLSPPQRMHKTGKYLGQRGFEWSIISSILHKLFPSSSTDQ